jgi:amidase
MPEEALQQAKELDAILEKTGKPIGPLHGLPVPVKVGILFPFILGTVVDQLQDTYWIKGQRTTMGFVAWKDNIATQDSTMAKILRDSGGKPTFPLTMSKSFLHCTFCGISLYNFVL